MAHTDSRRPTDVDEQIGRSIARRRIALRLSQTDLATAAGISFQQIQKYETGQNRVACSRLFQIAEVLEVSPGDLFPPSRWETKPSTARTSLEECGRLLAGVQPALDEALKIARNAW